MLADETTMRHVEKIVNETLTTLNTLISILKKGRINDAEYHAIYDSMERQSTLRPEIYTHIFESIARSRPIGRNLWYYTLLLDLTYDFYRITRYAWEIARMLKIVGVTQVYGETIRILEDVEKELRVFVSRILRGEISGSDASNLLRLEKISDQQYLALLHSISSKDTFSKDEVVNLLISRHVERMLDHIEYLVSRLGEA
ncbi:hypothetical protein ACSU1N_05875 [Thermogladius sp. 4427co]|uniref:hypothetical protein n=1 Tax=Thermogladius sp. 4427co TaxID=3450718 RepID=UPI003F792522